MPWMTEAVAFSPPNPLCMPLLLSKGTIFTISYLVDSSKFLYAICIVLPEMLDIIAFFVFFS